MLYGIFFYLDNKVLIENIDFDFINNQSIAFFIL